MSGVIYVVAQGRVALGSAALCLFFSITLGEANLCIKHLFIETMQFFTET